MERCKLSNDLIKLLWIYTKSSSMNTRGYFSHPSFCKYDVLIEIFSYLLVWYFAYDQVFFRTNNRSYSTNTLVCVQLQTFLFHSSLLWRVRILSKGLPMSFLDVCLDFQKMDGLWLCWCGFKEVVLICCFSWKLKNHKLLDHFVLGFGKS